MTDIDTAPVTGSTGTEYAEPDDHDRNAHIVVPAAAAAEAMITGVPCVALCGKAWVPQRDPDKFGVCPLCIETWETIHNAVWQGRR